MKVRPEDEELLRSVLRGDSIQSPTVDCTRGVSEGCNSFCCKQEVVLSSNELERFAAAGQADTTPIEFSDGSRQLLGTLKRSDDGYCVLYDQKTDGCRDYVHRPLSCRGFTCLDEEGGFIWKIS